MSLRGLYIVLERKAHEVCINHSHVFVLTLKYGTALDGMAAANGCAVCKFKQCVFIPANASIGACASLTGFGKRLLCLR